MDLSYGTTDIPLWIIVEKYREKMGCRGALISLYRHHRVQGCEETCATNYFEDITVISLTTGYPEWAEEFFNKWKSIIMKLKELYGGSGKINPT